MIAVVVLAVAVTYLLLWTPVAAIQPTAALPGKSVSVELPSDAEMIAHFQAHRADFKELVRLYQTNTWSVWREQDGKMLPFKTDEYQALLKRLNLIGFGDDGAIWLSDPYGVDTAKKAKAMNLFKAYAHHGIIVSTGNMRLSSRLGRRVWKDYFYVPVVPKVEKGLLWWPRSRYKGTLHRSSRVLESLDDYPAGWFLEPPQPRRGECVYRQFEPQWFLKLCNS